MLIDVSHPPFISCAPFSHKMEFYCIRIILEGLLGHDGVIQHILVVAIRVCGILDRNYHHYEILPKATDILIGLLHGN